jgi:glycosyltransferase involved in cell wall biosynthesis
MADPDISVILTAHREGILVGATAQSALAAVAVAAQAGLNCELIVVLDRADDLTTRTVRACFGASARIFETDYGDPGLARNHGIQAANGICATFLDGDDFWSENWLVECWKNSSLRPDAVFHSACNLVFGLKRLLFWHIDSEIALCDHSYLDWTNYWDALSFARTGVYRRFPFRSNDLKLRFGHEDWHWNAWTVSEGVPHKPAAGTMHFKRARRGSQMGLVDGIGGFRWPLDGGELYRLRGTATT